MHLSGEARIRISFHHTPRAVAWEFRALCTVAMFHAGAKKTTRIMGACCGYMRFVIKSMGSAFALRVGFALTASAVSFVYTGVAIAQTYPAKPIRIVVPHTAGGATDLIARPLANYLAERFNQSVVVDNRGGAGSLIGTDLVAKAAPDGYTLLAVASSLTMTPSLHRDLPYDPVRDFAPITMMVDLCNLLVVQPALPAKSVRELIAYAKANPGQVNFGSSGVGSGTHISMGLFMYMTGARMVHVPYKGGGQLVNALLGGEVQVSFATIPTAISFVKAGKLRALAVSTARRSEIVPDVPTIADSGVPGYDYSTWYGLLAPAHTPQPIIAKLHAEVVRIIQMPQMKAMLRQAGIEAVGNSQHEFAAIIKTEVAKWMRVVDAAGIKAEY